MHAAGLQNDDPRRGAKRHRQDSVSCDLGDVVDLSVTGLRVSRKGKPPFKLGQCVQVQLMAGGQALKITAQAMWMKRVGLRQYSVGMRFVSTSAPQRKALDSVSQFGFFRRNDRGESRNWGGEPANQQWRRTNESDEKEATVSVAVDLPDYYGILGVEAAATIDDIRTAYRAMVRKYHPDVASEPDAPERFEEVQTAYEMLKDPERRESYDARKVG